jgi:hypothetical protein
MKKLSLCIRPVKAPAITNALGCSRMQIYRLIKPKKLCPTGWVYCIKVRVLGKAKQLSGPFPARACAKRRLLFLMTGNPTKPELCAASGTGLENVLKSE